MYFVVQVVLVLTLQATLIEYNMRNIFFEKSYIKCGGSAIPTRFSEKSKLRISLDQQSKVLHRLFLLYVKLRTIEIY